MTEMKIGGRTIPLLFTTYEMIAIQRDIGCTAAELRTEVFGLYQEEEDTEGYHFDVVKDVAKMEKLGKLIRILGNAGLEESGQEPDLTDKWILRNMKPGLIIAYSIVAMTEINDGMSQEVKNTEKESGPVDELLEEQEAKKEPGK